MMMKVHDDVNFGGRLLHILVAVSGNARSPMA